MKKLLTIFLLGLTAVSTTGQSDKRIIFASMDALRGVGKYNGLG